MSSGLLEDDLQVRLRAMTFQGLGSNILAKANIEGHTAQPAVL